MKTKRVLALGAASVITAVLILGCSEQKDSLERFKAELEKKSVNTADKPYTAALAAINAVANGREISSIIDKAGKYVTLDLSAASVPNAAIGDMSFIKDNVFIKGIILPNVLVTIGDNSFDNCKELVSITIPPSVTSVSESAFDRCSGLETITVSRNNPAYADVDGALFDKDKTTLILYPEGKSGDYTIPSSVTTIGDFAFQYCEKLTSITIPPSITDIGDFAFQGCRGLTGITIPSSVAGIGGGAFSGCNGLRSITFEGDGTVIALDWSFASLRRAAGGPVSGPFAPQAGTYTRSDSSDSWTKQ
jgi:hypothetical protein